MVRKTDEDWRALKFHAGQLFTPSSPVSVTELFAGRKSQIDKLAEAIAERGRHAILYGEPGVGKTSIANVMRFFIPDTPQHVHFIRKAVLSSDTYSSIWLEIFKEISFSLIEGDTPVAHRVSDLYGDGVSQNDVIRELSNFGENSIPIIVIDEYQQFRDEEGAGYFSETIKAISDAGVKASMVVVGVGDSVNELVRGHSSIIRCSEEVMMPRMTSDEIQEIMNVRVSQLGMKLDGDARWKIVGLSKGLPAFTHALGRSAIYSAIGRRSMTITESDVDQGISDTISSSQHTLKSTYEEATNSNQERARFKHLLTACALTKTDASGWFTPKDVEEPFSNIMGTARRVDHFNANLKDFSTNKRGKVLQIKGTERAHRFRFAEPAMQPYVIMRGIEAGLVDRKAMAVLSSPEQDDLFRMG